MVREINPGELKPAAVSLLYSLHAALPHVRLHGAPLYDLSDVRAWLLQLAFAADPDGRLIPPEVWGVEQPRATAAAR